MPASPVDERKTERQSLREKLHCQLGKIIDSLSNSVIDLAVASGGDLLDLFHLIASQRRAKDQRAVSIGCGMTVMEPSVD